MPCGLPATAMSASAAAFAGDRFTHSSIPVRPLQRRRWWSGIALPAPTVATPAAVGTNDSSGSSNSAVSDSCVSAVAAEVCVFAPATIANLGPGFDWLGCAVDGLGDRVRARARSDWTPGTLKIADITGDNGRLTREVKENCVGIAAQYALSQLTVDVGVELFIEKGLPLGSGMGSSAASAAAGVAAVNELFGNPFSRHELVVAGLEAEAAVSGRHADNIAPAVLGGFVLVSAVDPELDLVALQLPESSSLWFALVTPDHEVPTREARAALAGLTMDLPEHIQNASAGAELIAAIAQGDVSRLGRALNKDSLVEPRRSKLIPGFDSVKEAAMEAGAFGCTISGAGPTMVAIADSEANAQSIASAMSSAFKTKADKESSSLVSRLNRVGAQRVE